MHALKTVTICGFLPRQVEVVRRRCTNRRLRLRFTSKKSNGADLRQSDLFIVTRFVSHTMTAAARELAGAHRVIFHTGGLASLVRLLHELTTRNTSLEGEERFPAAA